jgi:hypothetical protein
VRVVPLLLGVFACGGSEEPVAPPTPTVVLPVRVALVEGAPTGVVTDLVRTSDHSVEVFGSTGHATWERGALGALTAWAAPATGRIYGVDLDGDGALEAVATGGADAPTTVFGADGQVRFVVDAPGLVPAAALVADTDGDRDVEIVVHYAGSDEVRAIDHTGAPVFTSRWTADTASLRVLPGQPRLAHVDGISLVVRDPTTGEAITRARPTSGGAVSRLDFAKDLPNFPGYTLVVTHRPAGAPVRQELYAPDGETSRGSLPWESIRPYVGAMADTPAGRTWFTVDADERPWRIRFYDDDRAPLATEEFAGDAPALVAIPDGERVLVGFGAGLYAFERRVEAVR